MNESYNNKNDHEEAGLAKKLHSVAEQTQAAPIFISELEERLRDKYQPRAGWYLAWKDLMPTVGWVVFVLAVGILLIWSIRMLIPNPQPASNDTPTVQQQDSSMARPLTSIPNEATQTAQACEKVPYIVQANDTLSSIAASYNVPQDTIKFYNGLASDNVFLGTTIVIPLCERFATPRPTPTAENMEATSIPRSDSSDQSQEPPLVFFTSEPGKFQVWLPVSYSIQEFDVRQALFGQTIECPVLNFRLNGASATVQYCDLIPESIASLLNTEILDQARDEMIRGTRAKLEVQKSVIVQDVYPALALSGPVDMRGIGYDGLFKARLILARNRIYLIEMSVYLENWCNCLDQIDQVVESLYIETDLSIPFEPTP